MEMLPVTTAWLSSLDTLSEVPADQLQWLIDNSEHRSWAAGEFVVKPGDVIAGTHVFRQGRMVLYSVQEGLRRDFSTVLPGEITGYLPYSRAHFASMYGEITEDAQIMSLPRERIRDLITHNFELTQALVHVMTNRVRDFSLLMQQNEKMLALGKLSAGLAHELNNPAAAILRDAMTLRQHLKLVPDRFKEVMNIHMEPADVDAVSDLFFPMIAERKHQQLTLTQRMQQEEQLTDWMEERHVDNAGDIAETLVEFGICQEDLDRLDRHIPRTFSSSMFNWLHANLVTEKMVEDIAESSNRIANLVSSVKVFTHMDRDQGKALTDIHPGIRNTLVIMGFKIRKFKIAVVENYGADVPQVSIMPGEMNQVWTNLIDNALDAMEVNGKGTLTITTRRDRDYVEVTVADNGPGIPKEIQSRIFDPFFTTKELGKGTGMGLETVQKIVRQHHGSIKMHTSPEGTAFVVCLPVQG